MRGSESDNQIQREKNKEREDANERKGCNEYIKILMSEKIII